MDLTLVDLPTQVVRTERLVLRPYRPGDVEAVHRACQDSEIQRWLRVPSPYTEADAVEFVTASSVSASSRPASPTTSSPTTPSPALLKPPSPGAASSDER